MRTGPAGHFSNYQEYSPEMQSKVTRRAVLGLLLSIFLGLIGGIFGIILGRRSLKEIKKSGGSMKGRGVALSSIIVGIVSIVATIIVIASALLVQPPAYSVSITQTLYGTTCSNAKYIYYNFNPSQAVIVYSGPSGQQIASGTYGSGYDSSETAQSGRSVDVCIYTASVSGIPRGLGNYIVDDNGEGLSAGVSYTEDQVAGDNVGIQRGYGNY